MKITQRQVVIALISLLILVGAVVGIQQYVLNQYIEAMTCLVAVVLYGVALVAYIRGVDWARYIVAITLPVATGFSLQEPFVTNVAPFALAVAPVVTSLIGGPFWIAGSMLATHLILLARSLMVGAGAGSAYARADIIAISILVAGGLVLSRIVAENAQHKAEANAERAEKALLDAERQAKEIAKQADELKIKNEQQSRLIDLVATLETPAVSLAEGVLFAPIVGHLDSRRAQSLTNKILNAVSERRTRMVILDIAGVTTVDTQVAHALLQATQAIRLLGCGVTITGISASVATTITHLGISLEGIATARTPQDALSNN
jgi:rsbT co-antagonist protein RsbR